MSSLQSIHNSSDESTIVLSMDERMLKMWDESSGKPIVAIENTMKFNDFIRYKDSGKQSSSEKSTIDETVSILSSRSFAFISISMLVFENCRFKTRSRFSSFPLYQPNFFASIKKSELGNVVGFSLKIRRFTVGNAVLHAIFFRNVVFRRGSASNAAVFRPPTRSRSEVVFLFGICHRRTRGCSGRVRRLAFLMIFVIILMVRLLNDD